MKPVFQTLFGDKIGNCHAACIASIFEIPLEDVPNFCADPSWPENETAWLRERGFFRMQFDCGEGLNEYWRAFLTGPGKDLLVLAGVNSPRGPWLHSVIFQNGKLIHDPHPEGGSENAIPVDISFFIPIDPARMLNAINAANAVAHIISEALESDAEKSV